MYGGKRIWTYIFQWMFKILCQKWVNLTMECFVGISDRTSSLEMFWIPCTMKNNLRERVENNLGSLWHFEGQDRLKRGQYSTTSAPVSWKETWVCRISNNSICTIKRKERKIHRHHPQLEDPYKLRWPTCKMHCVRWGLQGAEISWLPCFDATIAPLVFAFSWTGIRGWQ